MPEQLCWFKPAKYLALNIDPSILCLLDLWTCCVSMDELLLTSQPFVWSWCFEPGPSWAVPVLWSGLGSDQCALLTHVPCREAGILHPDAPLGFIWGTFSWGVSGGSLVPSVTLFSPGWGASLSSPGCTSATVGAKEITGLLCSTPHYVHLGLAISKYKRNIGSCIKSCSFPGYFHLRILCIKPAWCCVLYNAY